MSNGTDDNTTTSMCTDPNMPYMVEGAYYCVSECEGNFHLDEESMMCIYKKWCNVVYNDTTGSTGDSGAYDTGSYCECGYGMTMDYSTSPNGKCMCPMVTGATMPMVWNDKKMRCEESL